MFPVYSFNNSINTGSVDSIFSGKKCTVTILPSVFFSYKNNLILCKNILRVFFSVIDGRKRISTFIKHIIHIVFKCSKKEMFRIYTTWIITFMTNIKTLWYFSKMDIPRNSMCSGRTSPSIKSDLSVSLSLFGSIPFPTFMKWNHLNFRPKSFFNNLHMVKTSSISSMIYQTLRRDIYV